MTIWTDAHRSLARRESKLSLLNMVSLFRQRTALRELDDHLLEDIGVTRAEAEKEAARPAWDAPSHWF